MFRDEEHPTTQPDPPCSICDKPAAYSAWGYALCGSCFSLWNAEPAIQAISARWREVELDTASLYTSATKVFVATKRLARAAA